MAPSARRASAWSRRRSSGVRTRSHSLPAVATWRGWRKVLTIPPDRFAWGFCHTLPEAEQRKIYERHVVPTPGRIFFQAAVGAGTKVNFRNASRAPLLITAGELDRAVDARMNRSNFRKYRRSPAVTDFEEWSSASARFAEVGRQAGVRAQPVQRPAIQTT